MVDGVTTNPSLILKSGRDIIEVTREICSFVKGPVSAEVVALKADDMIAEGRKLAAIAPNIAVKVPLTWDGLKTCKTLSDEGFMVNVTLCFSANQALLAAKAGATFISPFIGRLDDINLDGLDLIGDIRTIYDNYGFRDPDPRRLDPHGQPHERLRPDRRRCRHPTAPPAVIKAMANHVLTDKGLEQFMADWAKTGQKIV
jgi:transaldolase